MDFLNWLSHFRISIYFNFPGNGTSQFHSEWHVTVPSGPVVGLTNMRVLDLMLVKNVVFSGSDGGSRGHVSEESAGSRGHVSETMVSHPRHTQGWFH